MVLCVRSSGMSFVDSLYVDIADRGMSSIISQLKEAGAPESAILERIHTEFRRAVCDSNLNPLERVKRINHLIKLFFAAARSAHPPQVLHSTLDWE